VLVLVLVLVLGPTGRLATEQLEQAALAAGGGQVA